MLNDEKKDIIDKIKKMDAKDQLAVLDSIPTDTVFKSIIDRYAILESKLRAIGQVLDSNLIKVKEEKINPNRLDEILPSPPHLNNSLYSNSVTYNIKDTNLSEEENILDV